MKINTEKIVFDAKVSDLLFFWLMHTNENGPAADCDLMQDYFMDTFAWDWRGQQLMLGAIEDTFAQTEYDELCDYFNKHRANIGYIRIAPEHPYWDWDDVLTKDLMTFEDFVKVQV